MKETIEEFEVHRRSDHRYVDECCIKNDKYG